MNSKVDYYHLFLQSSVQYLSKVFKVYNIKFLYRDKKPTLTVS